MPQIKTHFPPIYRKHIVPHAVVLECSASSMHLAHRHKNKTAGPSDKQWKDADPDAFIRGKDSNKKGTNRNRK